MRSARLPTVPRASPLDFQERGRGVRHALRQRTGAMSEAAGRVADSTGNWVDNRAPAWARPYLRLARLDRPIGSWLLLLPCWWSVGLAAVAARAPVNIWHVVLFFIGAFAMRGAGCTWNDIVDRDLDARVERTRSRPIPSGQVSVQRSRGVPGCCRRWSASPYCCSSTGSRFWSASPRSAWSRSIRS